MVEVLIIGGGIIGASCAYHLVNAGVKDIYLIERRGIASQATGRSAGFITPAIFNEFSTGNSIGRYCCSFYEDLEATSETIEFHSKRAYTIAHTTEGKTELQSLQKRTDRACELLTAEELSTREADLSSEDVTGALAFDSGTHLDPYSVTATLLNAVEDDVTVLTETVVEDINKSATGFVVETSEGTFESPIVVNAAGAWANQLSNYLGISHPMMPRYSQVAVFDGSGIADFPFINYPDLGLYSREEPNGDIIVGGGPPIKVPDPEDFTTSAKESFLHELIEKAPKISPYLLDAKKINDWAGRCTATPDYHPIIGETDIEGFYICAGFNGGGVMHAPFAGRLLTELITGAESTFDHTAFSPDREAIKNTADFTIGKTALSW